MEHADDVLREGIGVKIEQPKTRQKIGFFYLLLLFLSLLLISVTIYILFLEGTGKSLPIFLKLYFA